MPPAAAWRSARTEACLDTTVHRTWTADTHARAMWCLDERRTELESMLAAFTTADATAMPEAVLAASALALIGPCRYADLLGRLPALPHDPGPG